MFGQALLRRIPSLVEAQRRLLLGSSGLLLAIAALGRAPLAAQGFPPRPVLETLVSTNPNGGAGSGDSTDAAISADGMWIAFQSEATDFVPGDGDRLLDIYLKDLAKGQMILVSTNPPIPGAVTKGNGPSAHPSVDAHGEFVVFASTATNLAPDPNGQIPDIFLHEVGTSKNVLISQATRTGADGPSDYPVISSDGLTIAFESQAGNLAAPATQPGVSRIHVFDVRSGEMIRLEGLRGALANGGSRRPRLSSKGDRVAFESDASNFVADDDNKKADVFLYDREVGDTVLVSVGAGRSRGDGDSTAPFLSGNGRCVAFTSAATNLAGGDRNKLPDAFVRDLAGGVTERVSVDADGRELQAASTAAGISQDGRFVGFVTQAPIDPVDKNQVEDVYVRDRVLGRTILASAILIAAGGGPSRTPNGPSTRAMLSEDGQSCAFQSLATDITRFDPTPRPDIYRALIPQALLTSFPPSNHVLIHQDGEIRQFEPNGKPTGKTAAVRVGKIHGFTVDDANAVWVVGDTGLARLQALSLEPADPDLPTLPVDFGPSRVWGLAARGGFAWVAVDASLWRVSADGEAVVLRLFAPPIPSVDAVSVAIDPFDHVWVSVAVPGRHTLVKVSKRLETLRRFTRSMNDPFLMIASDAHGSLFARSGEAIAKISSGGSILWQRGLAKGGGLGVDGAGNVYTVAAGAVVGFRGGGAPFLQVGDRGPAGDGRININVDGRGALYLKEEGARVAYQLELSSDREISLREFSTGLLGEEGGGDGTGFVAANVTARTSDADGDGILNGKETAGGGNPFDPKDPSAQRRLPPVYDLAATLVPNRGVRLTWKSSRPFLKFFIFRDGRAIQGSPFDFDDALGGVLDSNVPNGVHVYRVIGQGLSAEGAGGGFDDGSGQIPEPFSLPEESIIAQGDGAVLRSATTVSPPSALAFDTVRGRIVAALEGGILWELDTNLVLQDEVDLPADPFASEEVRGMAVDSGDASAPLYLMLADGRVYRRVGNGAPALLFTFSGKPGYPLPEGFTGLASTRGNSNDLFTTMAGPGVDCLIGFFRTSGVFKDGAETSVSTLIETPLDFAAGVAALGNNALLAGIGVNLDGTASSIRRVVKLDLGASFALGDAGSSVSLEALGSSDLPSFDSLPGVGLVVADRSGGRIAVVGAQLTGSLRITSLTPDRIRWDQSGQEIAIAGTGFGANAADLQVKFDGFDVPIQSLAAGVIRVDAPPLGRAKEITVEVSGTTSTDFLFPGFVYGFQRGDENHDGAILLSDAIAILNFLFTGGAVPSCEDSADVDDNEKLELTDAVYLLNYLFLGTKPKPPPPSDDFGVDPDGGFLDCGS